MSRTVPTDVTSSRKPAASNPATDKTAEIEERIERLEKRLDETIVEKEGDEDRHHRPKLDQSDVADPLRRSVERVNDRRNGSGQPAPAAAGDAPASPARTK